MIFSNAFEKGVKNADVSTPEEFARKGRSISDYLNATLFSLASSNGSLENQDIYRIARRAELAEDYIDRNGVLEAAKDRLAVREGFERVHNCLSSYYRSRAEGPLHAAQHGLEKVVAIVRNSEGSGEGQEARE